MRKRKNYWKESCLLLIGLILGCLYQKHFESLPVKTVAVVDSVFVYGDTIIKHDTIYKKQQAQVISKKKIPVLNKENVLCELKRQGLHHPNIVLAQSIHETGQYKSDLCKNYNNLFGIKRKDGSYAKYDDWTKSITSYKNLIQSKYKDGENYYKFLQRIGYAEDLDYINKLKKYV